MATRRWLKIHRMVYLSFILARLCENDPMPQFNDPSVLIFVAFGIVAIAVAVLVGFFLMDRISPVVAKLFGECEINMIPAQIEERGGEKWAVTQWGNVEFRVPEDVVKLLGEVQEVDLGCRTMAIEFSREEKEGFMKGSVYSVEPLGNKTELIVSIDENLIRFIIPVEEKFQLDEELYIGLCPEHIIFFDRNTQKLLAGHMEEFREVGM